MISIGQRQSVRQEQRLSPQVIQYIKLLTKTTLELEQKIKEELEINPLLEEGEELDADLESFETKSEESAEKSEEATGAEDDWDPEYFLHATDELYGYKAGADNGQVEDRSMPTPYVESTIEHLRQQIGMLELDDLEETIADQIIGSIDEDGYLRRQLESIKDDMMFHQGVEVSDQQLESVLSTIQHLDPIGIGSRTLQECLIVQLEVKDEDTIGRQVAIEILRDNYKAFTMKHFEQLQRKINVSKEELKAGFDLILKLNPKPGEGDVSSGNHYITPDFMVRYNEEDDDFTIRLNGKNAPALKISKAYREMLQNIASARKKGEKPTAVSKETKQFLKTKMDSAKWFINSIEQRRLTMAKVMETMVALQENFFRHGAGHLRPMILKDIAEKINMDISTVSRVVNGKYVQTEFGVFELKYFFSEGLSTDDGPDVSNKEIKALIRKIIEAEEKRRPLSDNKIATILDEQGFNIARRTVSKYREQLGIPVARMRKQIIV